MFNDVYGLIDFLLNEDRTLLDQQRSEMSSKKSVDLASWLSRITDEEHNHYED